MSGGLLTGAALLFGVENLLQYIQDLYLMKQLPELASDSGYSLILLVGLLTSFHCVGMCGGIAVSQAVRTRTSQGQSNAIGKRRFLPSAFYNGGRILSYTAIGGIAGGIGHVVQLTGIWKGVLPLFGGVFMVIMGINLLGWFKPLRRLNLRMPHFAAKRIMGGKAPGPFTVGLLSGLMPCGPLQIIQLFALGTGSILYGASAAFVFSLGTVPLMFVFGALNTVWGKRTAGTMMKVSAVLVIVLGGVMFSRGLALSGLALGHNEVHASDGSGVARLERTGKRQAVTVKAGNNSYPTIVVQKGVPVRWNLQVAEDDLNNCNNAIVVPGLHLEQKLAAGDNWITFTPASAGSYVYTCWMGMIKSTIVVVDDISRYEAPAAGSATEDEASHGKHMVKEDQTGHPAQQPEHQQHGEGNH